MTESAPGDVLVGRSVGEFVLRERIGEGGFGSVYRAVQPTLEREAVVKVLHRQLRVSEAAAQRFLREARLASKLDHPYAAHIYAFGAEKDGELWIAMELVRGTPLDKLLAAQGPLPLERFVPLLDRICEVVHTAHEQGIIHRDLKPANVMVLARAGRLLPKLLDFGIAKGLGAPATVDDDHARAPIAPAVTASLADSVELADTYASAGPEDTGSAELTQRGALIGSPHYMAPEQWIDAGKVDARTDLYSLGILAYEALTGHPPFVGRNLTMLAVAHATTVPPPLGGRFPPALDRVFEKVLAKAPEERYGDAVTFAAAFRQAAGIGGEAVALPSLDPAIRDAALANAPLPIAEAIAALDAARNEYQARDAVVMVAHALVRYLGVLALACRSRVSREDEPPGTADVIRMLRRRQLTDAEWVALVVQLTRAWREQRDAYPVPELVEAFHDHGVGDELLALTRMDHTAGEGGLVAHLERAVPRLSRLLASLPFLDAYVLAVTSASGHAERWMGARRAQRTTIAVRGRPLDAGLAILLDDEGAPVLSLAPLVQVAAPTPGSPLELFLFDGPGRNGAKLVALPGGFEHHDDTLWSWFRAELAGDFDEGSAPAAEEKPPYRGLSAFSADDGALFFGREKQIDAFVNRLRVSPLLAVVGRSGAGKSSFVHAGVLPALPEGWRRIVMRPGPSPLTALVARLEHAGLPKSRVLPAGGELEPGALADLLRADAAARGPLVVVVDQLEELFTLCADERERALFAEIVAAIARDADDPVRVIFTLRDDFLVRAEQLAPLRNRIGQGLQLLTVPAVEDLVRVVVEPARRVGYELEDEQLAREMVGEVADQPGALALISFTAAKLWELRDRHFKQLTRSAYRSLGGVGGALARHAEQMLDQMPAEARALTREAFRHLVTTQNTRAVLRRKDLRHLLGDSEDADHVIEELVAARLLSASEDDTGAETIEIVHEALLAAWPRLVEWQHEDREGARFREQLRSAAAQWRERGGEAGLLWRGDALADYTRWRARHADQPLTELEAAFADASLADATRGRRLRRGIVVGAFAISVVVVVVLLQLNRNAETARRTADRSATEAHHRLLELWTEQGRQAVLADDPLRAVAFLDQASRDGATGPDLDVLVGRAARLLEGQLARLTGHDQRLWDIAWSPDGKRLVTCAADRTARVWDAATGTSIAVLAGHTEDVETARFSPDGTRIATASFDGRAIIWDAATGAIERTLGEHGRRLFEAEWSPDGRQILTAGEDGVARLWDVATGAPAAELAGHKGWIAFALFDRLGEHILTGGADHVAIVWNAQTHAPVARLVGHDDVVLPAAFSADGTRVVTGSDDTRVRVWDAASGRLLVTFFGHSRHITSVTFSPDGRLVASASEDHSAAVWDATTGAARFVIRDPGPILQVLFSPDGTRLVTAGAEVQLWSVADGEHMWSFVGHQDVAVKAAFDARGDRLVTASADHGARVWDARRHDDAVTLRGHAGAVWDGRWSPSGDRVLTAGDDRTIAIHDAHDGKVIASFDEDRDEQRHEEPRFARWSPRGDWFVARRRDHLELRDPATMQLVREISVGAPPDRAVPSPDGQRLAVVADRTVHLVDLQGVPHGVLAGHAFRVRAVAWSPDGRRLVTGSEDNTARIWDAATGKQLETLSGHTLPVVAVAWSPDGRRVLTASEDRTMRAWELEPARVVVGFEDDASELSDAAFSPDGAHVATIGGDGAVKLWSAATGQRLATIGHHPGVGTSVAFSPDGHRVLSTATDGTARIWDVPGSSPAAEVLRTVRCAVPFHVENERIARGAPTCGGM